MHWLLIYNIVSWVLRIIMIAIILRRRLTPPIGLAWLSFTMFLPEVAIVFYMLIGEHRMGLRKARKHRAVIDAIRSGEWREFQKIYVVRPELEPAQLPMVLQAEKIGGMQILGSNSVEFLTDTDDVINRLVQDIDGAKTHVHLLYYIFAPDAIGERIGHALERAASRGVTCRLLADEVGSRGFFRRGGLASRLSAAGVKVVPLLPVNIIRRRFQRLDMRNHRKLAVIDGRIGYTGSHNIIDASYGRSRLAGKWIDLTGRFQGPVVSQMQTVFIEDWRFETDEELESPDIFPVPLAAGEVIAQSVPTGPSHDTGDFHRILITAINTASRKIIITTPYLVPDEPTMLALAMAADRGVEVNLVIPLRSDHPLVLLAGESYYETLLESGVRIFLHKHGLLHAKTMTVDDSFALLGSANLDIRSFYINFEMSVLLYGPTITSRLRFAQTRYIAESEELRLDKWRTRPRWLPYLEQTAALASPLL